MTTKDLLHNPLNAPEAVEGLGFARMNSISRLTFPARLHRVILRRGVNLLSRVIGDDWVMYSYVPGTEDGILIRARNARTLMEAEDHLRRALLGLEEAWRKYTKTDEEYLANSPYTAAGRRVRERLDKEFITEYLRGVGDL